MKKTIFILLLDIALVLGFGSCKKVYNCTCTLGGRVDWQGDVEATSASNAQNIAQTDAPGDQCTCK
jgi:hypothetical protein